MVKSRFSIKDLENLSGVKSHTIRIWEKRYNLLTPDRTDTNIRTYNLHSLRKILNVSFLKNNGMRISSIAKLNAEEIEEQVRTIAESENINDHYIQKLKLAMINFDQVLFQKIYKSVYDREGFNGVFYQLFIPFLEELGLLWQSKTINIAHEHFISHLIKQKMLVELEKLQYQSYDQNDRAYILFLPDNEMHDLGLLFLNYQLLSHNKRTIYLGESMLIDALKHFKNKEVDPVYLTYMTVNPMESKIPSFLRKFHKKIQKNNDAELWVFGYLSKKIKEDDLHTNQRVFTNIHDVIKQLPQLVSA
ncbi:MerR family transcriptional regulator [Nonlabens spongiae]|uniref:MerR family transcriptional regulator n=1 Tax=Nonlabens spongiae TaxID=331648 RepID=A0A1W6MG63_9FLAO|nr:MerR family transcriptional regulator [Nonlabens spongiae]ARN76567.1 MerR family transcriptional regulator [Nonlabens spongiae]